MKVCNLAYLDRDVISDHSDIKQSLLLGQDILKSVLFPNEQSNEKQKVSLTSFLFNLRFIKSKFSFSKYEWILKILDK